MPRPSLTFPLRFAAACVLVSGLAASLGACGGPDCEGMCGKLLDCGMLVDTTARDVCVNSCKNAENPGQDYNAFEKCVLPATCRDLCEGICACVDIEDGQCVPDPAPKAVNRCGPG